MKLIDDKYYYTIADISDSLKEPQGRIRNVLGAYSIVRKKTNKDKTALYNLKQVELIRVLLKKQNVIIIETKVEYYNSKLNNMEKEFIEGKDYYLEDGRVHLTEEYLKERKECCGNNCRHCCYTEKVKGNTVLRNSK